MRNAARELRDAVDGFNGLLEQEAKRQCLSLCKKMVTKLPRELRDQVYDHIITERNVTFYRGPNDKVKLANGTSAVHHVFDSEYTGSRVHTDILDYLCRESNQVRFDFGRCHDMVHRVFEQYPRDFNIDLAGLIRRTSVTIRLVDLTKRDTMLQHLEALSKLDRGTTISFVIEARHRAQNKVLRSFHKMISVIAPLLHSLDKSGYSVKVILNPSYSRSNVNIRSLDAFNIIGDQTFRYVFTSENSETSVEDLKIKLIEVWYNIQHQSMGVNCGSTSRNMVTHGTIKPDGMTLDQGG